MKRSARPAAPTTVAAPDSALSTAPANGQAAPSPKTPNARKATNASESPTPATSRTADAAPAGDTAAELQASADAMREQRVRHAAYARWQQRGHEAGDPRTDWLEAEAELTRKDPHPSTIAP